MTSKRVIGWALLVPVAITIAALLVGCAPGASSPAPSRTALKVGLGYIPSVQFAPFYLADKSGYYASAGLDVSFNNRTDTDVITLLATGAIDIGIADGTSIVTAVSQGIPIQYATTIFADFPNVVMSLASSPITAPGDLRGALIGTPGKYGSSWIMLQALLGSAGLTTNDVQVTEFPDYSQAGALTQGRVDAATAFLNNEPVALAAQGIQTVQMSVDDVVPLPGNGLIVKRDNGAEKLAALRAFVSATLRAMNEITADPAKGVDAAIAAVPELASNRDLQTQILAATIGAWHSDYTDAHGLGSINPSSWSTSIAFMEDLDPNLVPNPISVDDVVTNAYLPAATPSASS